jgi:hypothetical protein
MNASQKEPIQVMTPVSMPGYILSRNLDKVKVEAMIQNPHM